uniref:Cleavage and polyadenylation specificity factor subunit 6 n=1 Tax=Cyprinus carpio TaxID=7962 RepID=A0A8C2GSQ2_CYPCA
MADGVDHIDIYADVEEEFNQVRKLQCFLTLDAFKPVVGDSNTIFNTTWTTDEDLTDAIRSVGINDVLEIKFFENRANGQSKGFALVCVGSDSSSRKLMDLLSKRELHGQNPIVTPCNKQSLSQFEMQSRKSTQSGQMSGEGKAGPPGPPNRGDRPLPPVMFPGQFGQPPMGPMPPGPPPPGYGPPPGPPPLQQGLPPPGPFPPRPPGPLGPPLGLVPPPHMQGPPPGGPPPAPHVNPAFFPPPGNNNMPSSDSRGPPPGDMYGRPPPYDRDYGPGGRDLDSSRAPLSEAEFEEIMNRNRAISSSAISRAVSDASAADYGSAIETLVTAISLIKQSKVSADDRCKVLISSLQDCLHGIESKSYGSASRDHSSADVTKGMLAGKNQA